MSDSDRRHRTRTVYIAVVAAVVASVLTTYGLRALEGGGGGGAGSVQVPEVAGIEVETARERLRQRGLFLVVDGEEHSDDQPAQHVVRQEPAAASEAEAGTTVTVVVSLGPSSVEVPDLTGLTVNSARGRLDDVGLSLGDDEEGGSGDPGTVTAQSPEAGAEVEVGSSVDITVAPEGIPVPEVVGTSYRSAKTQLEELGFTVQMRRGWNEMLPPMQVLGVEPEAGTLLPPGSEVTVRVND